MNTAKTHIGDRVRQARRIQKVSADIIAKHLGISIAQLNNYELGKHNIPSHRLGAVATLLDMPIAWFYQDVTKETEDNIRNIYDQTLEHATPVLSSIVDLTFDHLPKAVGQLMERLSALEKLVSSGNRTLNSGNRTPNSGNRLSCEALAKQETPNSGNRTLETGNRESNLVNRKLNENE